MLDMLSKLLSKKIYMDNSATTVTRKEVAKEINRYMSNRYGNPSSAHRSGVIARGSIELARESIAKILNCSSSEIIFTGSGSEGNNTSIKGATLAAGKKGHIITSGIEHNSILNTCKALEKEGFEVTYIDVDYKGRYDLDKLKNQIKDETILVSLSYVNNEIGTVQDVKEISKIVKGKGKLLHIDAVQALPYYEIDLKDLRADLVTFSGHKLYAPKGIGILYVKEGTPIEAIISGGEQEFGLRSGTENVPYIMGLSKAISINHKEKKDYVNSLIDMRETIIKEVLKNIDDVILTGDLEKRSPNNASFCFKGVSGKMLVKQLSWYGFETSSGSACSSPKNEASHVLTSCKINDEYIHGSLRISLGKYNTRREIEKLLRILPEIIRKMREDIPMVNINSTFISQKEFKNKQSNNEKLQILDVRPVFYPNIKIPGAIYVPIWKLKKIIRSLESGVETIVICNHGDIVAPEAQQFLIKEGFKNVRVLKGGLAGYMSF
jgi:cysteine desulfurase